MIAEAARLRDLYRLQTGLQNGPYFDIQTKDFALIAIDTGVLKSVDPAQEHWLEESALPRRRANSSSPSWGTSSVCGRKRFVKQGGDCALRHPRTP